MSNSQGQVWFPYKSHRHWQTSSRQLARAVTLASSVVVFFTVCKSQLQCTLSQFTTRQLVCVGRGMLTVKCKGNCYLKKHNQKSDLNTRIWCYVMEDNAMLLWKRGRPFFKIIFSLWVQNERKERNSPRVSFLIIIRWRNTLLVCHASSYSLNKSVFFLSFRLKAMIYPSRDERHKGRRDEIMDSLRETYTRVMRRSVFCFQSECRFVSLDTQSKGIIYRDLTSYILSSFENSKITVEG